MTRSRLTGNGDATLFEKMLEEIGGVQGGLFDGQDELARSARGRERAGDGDDAGARLALQSEIGLYVGGGRLDCGIDSKLRSEGIKRRGDRDTRRRAGSERQRHRIVVDDD